MEICFSSLCTRFVIAYRVAPEMNKTRVKIILDGRTKPRYFAKPFKVLGKMEKTAINTRELFIKK